jgi:hypothetical protein
MTVLEQDCHRDTSTVTSHAEYNRNLPWVANCLNMDSLWKELVKSATSETKYYRKTINNFSLFPQILHLVKEFPVMTKILTIKRD